MKQTQFNKAKKFIFLILLVIILSPRKLFSKGFILPLKYLSFNIVNIYKSPYRKKICYELTQNIHDIIKKSTDISYTVYDSKGFIISEHNGSIPRIPASNQKLLSTAFAIDKLGPNFSLETSIYRSKKGFYSLISQGDPDINYNDVSLMHSLINKYHEKHYSNENNINIKIFQLSRELWWPSTWNKADRLESYGAPITKLAFTSNSSGRAIIDPSSKIRNIFLSLSGRSNYSFDISTVKSNNYNIKSLPLKLVFTKSSASMNSLMSLANSESHNFTAEVLLRHAAKSWDIDIASNRLRKWLSSKGIPIKSFVIKDGSGLSRSNRATTRGLAYLLYIMSFHPYNYNYQSSLAINGLRGTLISNYSSNSTYAKFYGKTGTLTGVRSLSGVLEKETGKYYISIISYNQDTAITTFSNFLDILYNNNNCLI